jgi:HPt (histidine-containing phosphotransfer) domain-containing protein
MIEPNAQPVPYGVEQVDPDFLLELVGDDQDFARELVLLFAEDTSERLAEIDEALTAADADTVGAQAHAIKGAASNIGATSVQELAFRLERMGKGGDLSEAPDVLGQLRDAVERTNAYFSARYVKAA